VKKDEALFVAGAQVAYDDHLSPSNTAIEMQRKFDVYRDAGVREYWVLDSLNKTLTAHLFQREEVITRIYDEKDSVPVAVLNGLSIELSPVFTE
jgi:Uma2 family endonuclease